MTNICSRQIVNFCYKTKPYKLIIPQRNITIQSINDLYYENLQKLGVWCVGELRQKVVG